MNVLIVHPHMAFGGGAELVVANLANYLSRKGVDNTILTLSEPLKSLEIHDRSNIVTPARKYTPKVRSESFLNALGTLDEIFALRALVRKYADSFDLINAHNFPATWAVPRGKPSVWMCNEPPDLWGNAEPSVPLKMLRNIGAVIDKTIVDSINKICVADEFNAARVLETYGRKTEIIPYGIDYEFFCNNDNENFVLEKFSLSADDLILLQVGWLSPAKNQLESVKAVKRLKETISDVKLILVGASVGSYEKTLKEYVVANGLKDHVVFLDFQAREIVRELHHIADIVIHPVNEQGGWLTPFEALCASTPIIVSKRMTAANIISKEEIGVVTDDLVGAIHKIYNRPKEYKKMALRGKQYVANNLSWDAFGKRMLSVFENVVS